MFEKESKEYRNHNTNYYEWDAFCADDGEAIEEAYQKGAEFGYNKANEWHYPSKGEYPKDEKDLLMSNQLILIIKIKGSDALSLALGQYNFSTQEFCYQHLVGLTEVIAWKEIVLPKESE